MSAVGLLTVTAGVIVGSAGVIVGSAIWGGLVLSILWGWFIVPVFHVSTLTIAQAIGITLVVSLLRSRRPSPEERSETLPETMRRAALVMFIMPLVCLAAGAIVRLWLP
ncbi:MAG: hypothetical protein ABIP42_09530 [Planctomycetota bacterium]